MSGTVSEENLETPSVSIVISHLNSARTLRACLEAVTDQNYPKDRFEVIVVDAGSNDGSIEIARSLTTPNLALTVVPGCSEAAGQIEGLRRATGSVIFLTNSDIYVPHDWIRLHLSWHARGFDLVGGSVFWGGDKFALSWNPPRMNHAVSHVQPGVGVGFSNCSVSRKSLEESGGLKDVKSHHDSEFAFRLVARGGKLLLDPNIQVYHDHPFGSFKGCFRRSYGYAVNHVTIMRALEGGVRSKTSIVSMDDSLKNVGLELLLVNGVLAYQQTSATARSKGIRVGLLEFMLIRMFGHEIARYLGWLVGLLSRRPSTESVRDLHSTKQTYS